MVTDDDGRVREIQVKRARCALALDLGRVQDARRDVLHELHALWLRARAAATSTSARWSMPGSQRAARRCGVRAGESYVDVGTLHGYREAIRLLGAAGCAPRRPRVASHAARGTDAATSDASERA